MGEMGPGSGRVGCSFLWRNQGNERDRRIPSWTGKSCSACLMWMGRMAEWLDGKKGRERRQYSA